LPGVKNNNKDEFVISDDDGGHEEIIIQKVYPGDTDPKHAVFKRAGE